MVTNEKPVLFREYVVHEVDEGLDAATLEGGEVGSIVDHGDFLGVQLFAEWDWVLGLKVKKDCRELGREMEGL